MLVLYFLFFCKYSSSGQRLDQKKKKIPAFERIRLDKLIQIFRSQIFNILYIYLIYIISYKYMVKTIH